MSEAKLVAKPRTEFGTRACNRLRLKGIVPGNVYGHKQETTAIQVRIEDFRPIIKAGIKVVDLEVDGQHDKALLRELKFDALGDGIEHFDLMRVDPNERVTLHVPVVLKGTAPGAIGSGAVLEQPLHSLTIDCLAYLIPDAIQVKVGSLQAGQAIHVRDLELPQSVHVHNPADAIVVHIVTVQNKAETPIDAASAATQPEVVGKKPATDAGEAAAPAKKK